MTRVLLTTIIAAAIATILTARWRRGPEGLPPDDGPAELWVDEYMGEPWGSYYERRAA